MGRKDRPEIKELLETINKNAKRLQRLTEDVLDKTRMDSKSLLLYKDKFDLNDIILDILKIIKIPMVKV